MSGSLPDWLAGRRSPWAANSKSVYLPLAAESRTSSPPPAWARSASSSTSASDFSDVQIQSGSSSGSKMPSWPYLRRLVGAVVVLVVLAMACFGAVVAVLLLSGHIMRTPVYTNYDIGQAGWSRQPLLPPNPQPTSSPPSSTPKPSLPMPNTDRNNGSILSIHDFDAASSSIRSVEELHVLILTPLRNAEKRMPHFLSIIEGLDHPKANTSIGFLVGDEEDKTGMLVDQWCQEQEEKKLYRGITLLKKDFQLDMPGGDSRHANWLQPQRRELMAKARTLLLTSTLEASVDWVLWLDSDVYELSSSIISDLLFYGNAGVSPQTNISINGEAAPQPYGDIITPNVMTRKGNYLKGYDLNNWAETPESIEMKNHLAPDTMLFEGNRAQPTYRYLLARHWVEPNVSSSWDLRSPHYPYDPFNPHPDDGPSNLYDPDSDAYIGRTIDLDGVGGVATLVRADTHRFGAVFPSWLVDHQVETEGFGVMARRIGARIVGLPNYIIMHQPFYNYLVPPQQPLRSKVFRPV